MLPDGCLPRKFLPGLQRRVWAVYATAAGAVAPPWTKVAEHLPRTSKDVSSPLRGGYRALKLFTTKGRDSSASVMLGVWKSDARALTCHPRRMEADRFGGFLVGPEERLGRQKLCDA